MLTPTNSALPSSLYDSHHWLLREAREELREGLSEDEIREIIWAMNVEYIEPDDSEFAER